MSKKLAGKKYAGSHGTIIDAAYDLIRLAERKPEVEKISLGIIRSVPSGRGVRTLKVKETSSGFELMVRGSSYVQMIYLYLSSQDKELKNQLKSWLGLAFRSRRER